MTVIGKAAQRVYDELRQAVDDPSGDLYTYVGALGDELLQDVENLVRDGDNGETGWSKVLDLSRVPDEGLDWLAQFIGVRFPSNATVAVKRSLITARTGWQRGTPAAIIAAAQTTLTGTKLVTLVERNGDAYNLSVTTKASETPDPSATLEALLSQKPAGIILLYQNLDGQLYLDLFNNQPTYDTTKNAYATYQDLLYNNQAPQPPVTSNDFGTGNFGSGTFGGL